MKQKLKEIILENQEFKAGSIINRINLNISLNSGIIVSIMGARRSGKTFLLYYLIEELKRQGVTKEQIVFINFEDERLNLTQADLDLILQAYQEIYPETNLSDVYFFFDEIQNVKGWEKFTRRVYDTKTKKIFITGSNSKLLSSEIATALRGRTISYTVYPLNFKEYLQTQNAPSNLNTQTNRAKVIHLAEKFLFEGGFPELIGFDKSLKIKVLQDYFNVMIYRDIIERYTISNPEVLKFFIKKIFSSVTSPLSVNKAYNDIKSMGYKISNKYLYEYLAYCNAIFLTQSIHKFNFSEIKQAKSDKKVYIIDNGLLSAIDFNISENRGKLLENMVAMEYLKQDKALFYYKDQYECDFIVKDGNKLSPVQVAWTINDPATRYRELRGIYFACKLLNQDKGTIITFDEEEVIETDSVTIRVLPFYKYFGFGIVDIALKE
jgi:predicted AAA+ superfamily ATPase